MSKKEFIDELRIKLSKLNNIDIEERLRFYEEMINDRMEDGFSEDEAISGIGTIDEIYIQISQSAPKSHLTLDKARQKFKSRNNKKVIILSSTAIIWVPVLIALGASAIGVAVSLVATVLSLYATLWALVVSAWSIFAAFAISAPAGALIGILNVFSGDALLGIAVIGGGIMAAGLAIFAFYGALYATKGSTILTKKSFSGISKLVKKVRR